MNILMIYFPAILQCLTEMLTRKASKDDFPLSHSVWLHLRCPVQCLVFFISSKQSEVHHQLANSWPGEILLFCVVLKIKNSLLLKMIGYDSQAIGRQIKH